MAEINDRDTIPQMPAAPERKKRGFAAMDPKLVSEIASKGGKAAHAQGKAHQFTSDEAKFAGKKGGAATHAKLRRIREQNGG
jgi:general stress protein YciG